MSFTNWFNKKEEQRTIEQLKSVVHQADAFSALIKMEGWQIIQERWSAEIRNCTNELIDAKPEDVIRYQERIKILKKIFDFIDQTLSLSESAKDELLDIENSDHKPRALGRENLTDADY